MRKKEMSAKQKDRDDKIRLIIECTKEEHQKIKMFAAYKGKSIKGLILESVLGNPKHKGNIPNDLTEKVLSETERGENVEEYDSIEDFWKSLGFTDTKKRKAV